MQLTKPITPAAWPMEGGAVRQVGIDAGVALLCILPLLITAHLPLTDLPNHLARQYILHDLPNSAVLRQFYTVHWALIPNLALEVFMVAARQVMPLDLAMRAFCITTVLLLFLGTRLVNRRFGEGRAYRAVPVLCYGGPFQYGFLGYCFGVGLALLLFGFWIGVRQRGLAARCAFLLAGGFGLLLCHLAAFGLFAIAVGICELTGGAATRLGLCAQIARRLAIPVLCLGAVMAVFILLGPAPSDASDHAVRFSSLHEKMRSLLSITFFTQPVREGALLVAALAGLAAAFATRAVRWHLTGLCVVIGMGVVWLMLPNIALGTTFIDYRLPWAVAFFVLAALVPGRRYGRFVWPLAAYVGILGVVRIAMIATLWLRWEPTLAAIDDALARLPAGSKLMVIEGRTAPEAIFRDPDLSNVASYAVARRQAFYPGMFAGIEGQVLAFQPHSRALWERDGFVRGLPDTLTSLAPDYDHVLVLLPQYAHVAPDLPLQPEASGEDFTLLKVIQPGR
jgi:hypothetical protein